MALKGFIGFESGTLLEFSETNGSPEIISSVRRSGDYAARISPAGATEWGEVRPLSSAIAGGFFLTGSAGTWVNGDYFTIPFVFTTLPDANRPMLVFLNNSDAVCARVKCSSGGSITIVGATTSASAGTITANSAHYLRVRCLANSTCEVSLDGAAAVTCTGNNFEPLNCRIGSDEAATYNLIVDDFIGADTAYESHEQIVTRMDVDGAGDFSAWTDGTGTTFAECDDIPHDGDTTYIQENTAFGSHYFSLESCANAGVTGTIAGVWTCAICAVTSGTGQCQPRLIMGGTTIGSATTGDLNTTYRIMGYFTTVDPSDSLAITTTDLDGTQIGVRNPAGTDTKCTAMYLMVLQSETSPTWTGLGSVPSASGLTVDYNDFTRAGVNNTPWGLDFTPSDADTPGANALTWQVRTAAGGGGTLVASGTCTHAVPVSTTIAYNASGLVNGSQTLYLRLNDGTNASDTAFTLKRDDDAPTATTAISVTGV